MFLKPRKKLPFQTYLVYSFDFNHKEKIGKYNEFPVLSTHEESTK